jgi:hypothetical protein
MAQVAMGDGSVQSLSEAVSMDAFFRLIAAQDGLPLLEWE